MFESPHINEELKNIGKTLESGEVDILLNEQSTLVAIEAKLRENERPYSVIHFSTYNPFGNRSISRSEETFLQTYDASLSMDKLEELINPHSFGQTLDILTLSACNTAIIGEPSSLELVGIAAKTKARSVLASLGIVNDEATAKLMTGFYQHWQQNDFSNKAKALQQAQLELLKTSEFKHPYYWASFVLIGNWQ